MSKKRRSHATSPAQQAANQQNAQLSTGPKTPEGKSQLATHALKHGLTAKKLVLLPWEDPQEYQDLHDRFWQKLNPVTPQQETLAKSIIANHWRLQRVFAYENVAGNTLLADTDTQPATLTDTPIFIFIDKVLMRLSRYEATIRKNLKEDELKYQDLQSPQPQAAAAQHPPTPAKAAHPQPSLPGTTQPPAPVSNGFVSQTTPNSQLLDFFQDILAEADTHLAQFAAPRPPKFAF